jgi:hypothetical protein
MKTGARKRGATASNIPGNKFDLFTCIERSTGRSQVCLTGSIYFDMVLAWGSCAERCRSYSESGMASGRGQKLQRESPLSQPEVLSFRNTTIEPISNENMNVMSRSASFCRVRWRHRDSKAFQRLLFWISPYLAPTHAGVRCQNTTSLSVHFVRF